MDTLEIAYKLLYSLEHKQRPAYMGQIISPAALDVPEDKWLDVIQALMDEGYIAGVSVSHNVLGGVNVDVRNARITLRGAQYLRENSAMVRFGKVATDIINVIKP